MKEKRTLLDQIKNSSDNQVEVYFHYNCKARSLSNLKHLAKS